MRYPAILAAALGAAAAFGAAPAAAAPASVAVRYADLDLSSEAGQKALERRLNRAARSVCGVDRVPTGSLMPSAESRQCFAETRARVHAQVAAAIARGSRRG